MLVWPNGLQHKFSGHRIQEWCRTVTVWHSKTITWRKLSIIRLQSFLASQPPGRARVDGASKSSRDSSPNRGRFQGAQTLRHSESFYNMWFCTHGMLPTVELLLQRLKRCSFLCKLCCETCFSVVHAYFPAVAMQNTLSVSRLLW
jgi:hypothetical protein